MEPRREKTKRKIRRELKRERKRIKKAVEDERKRVKLLVREMKKKEKTRAKKKFQGKKRPLRGLAATPAAPRQQRDCEGLNGLARLALEVEKQKRKIGPLVRKRVGEFRKNKNLFSELCFCILTANYTAEGGMRIQKGVKDFSKFSEKETEAILRKFGHRFPRTRANYIFLARKHKGGLGALCQMKSAAEQREWLVKNVKGLGYKEASHFLRNTGVLDVAIIDRHIISVLGSYGLITPPKTITKRKYLEIESILKKLSEKTRVPLGELDLYLWHMKTGKVLK